jgi:NAD(P)H-hydrate epimerase
MPSSALVSRGRFRLFTCVSSSSSTPGCVRADLTVTFQYLKIGMLHPASMEVCGLIESPEIGLADWREAGIHNPAWDGGQAIWPVLRHARPPHSQKGDYGKLLVIGGSRRYPGAPRLAALAAMRCGSGLTRLLVPESIYAVSCGEPALMVDSYPTNTFGGFAARVTDTLREYIDWADTVVLGPGLGSDEASVDFCRRVLSAADKPIVLDADGLRALDSEPAQERRWPLLLTPHAAELGRLSGHSTAEVYAQWFKLPQRLAELHKAYVLAKSNQCVLAAPDGHLYFPSPGLPALAKGGSGDVLSGILGALLARAKAMHRQDSEAAHEDFVDQLPLLSVTAVNLLNQAAALGVRQFGENGLSPSDIPLLLTKVLRRIHEAPHV